MADHPLSHKPKSDKSSKAKVNKAVSRKISKFRGEGIPAKQAIAKAINMTSGAAGKGRKSKRR